MLFPSSSKVLPSFASPSSNVAPVCFNFIPNLLIKRFRKQRLLSVSKPLHLFYPLSSVHSMKRCLLYLQRQHLLLEPSRKRLPESRQEGSDLKLNFLRIYNCSASGHFLPRMIPSLRTFSWLEVFTSGLISGRVSELAQDWHQYHQSQG